MCGFLPHAPIWEPSLQPWHLLQPGNGTDNLLVGRQALSLLSHTSQHGIQFSFYFFEIYFIDQAITVVSVSSLHSPLPYISLLPAPFSSCPWVVHMRSLASTFPVLSLPSPCLFSTYHLCYLFSAPFPSLSPSQSPIDNPPSDLHFCGSVSVLVGCLVFFSVGFRCGC